MKNYTTPRTMSEASINASYDPIERLKMSNDFVDTVVTTTCVVLFAVVAAIIYIWG